MILPPEAREIVFEYCLVLNRPINPHPACNQGHNVFAEDDKKPDTALFRVDKVLGAEATRVFYGKNVFRLNIEFDVLTRGVMLRTKLSRRYRGLIRQVITSFSPLELPPSYMVSCNNNYHAQLPGADNWRERSDTMHDERQKVFRIICDKKIRALQRMYLQSCVIDVSDLWCPNGCCREDAVFDVCYPLGLRDRKPKEELAPDDFSTKGTVVTITGAKSEEEHVVILHLFGLEPKASI